MKLLLVASSGGHLFELFCVRDFWASKEHTWVSFATQDAEWLLRDEDVDWAAHPTNRNLKNLLKNAVLAWRVLRSRRPDVVITTGAGVAVPFLILARFFGIRTVFVESVTRISELSLSAYMVYPFLDCLLVQWEELAERYGKAQYHGRIV